MKNVVITPHKDMSLTHYEQLNNSNTNDITFLTTLLKWKVVIGQYLFHMSPPLKLLLLYIKGEKKKKRGEGGSDER